jgi:hypothetical protein
VCCWLKRLYTIITNTSGWATTNPVDKVSASNSTAYSCHHIISVSFHCWLGIKKMKEATAMSIPICYRHLPQDGSECLVFPTIQPSPKLRNSHFCRSLKKQWVPTVGPYFLSVGIRCGVLLGEMFHFGTVITQCARTCVRTRMCAR